MDGLLEMLHDTCEIPTQAGLTGSFKHIFNEGYTVGQVRKFLKTKKLLSWELKIAMQSP